MFQTGSKVVLLVTCAKGYPQLHKKELKNWELRAPVSGHQDLHSGREHIKLELEEK